MQQSTYVAQCDVGRGVFAARPFVRGERILSFRGPSFTAHDPLHFTPEGANLLQVAPLRYIYPRPKAVYVNHSCNPNAGLRGTVTLVALRDIAAGEEIRFDYSTTMDENLWTMECRCGEPCCRGIVGDFRDLPVEVRARYIEMGIVPDFISGVRRRGNGHSGRATARPTMRPVTHAHRKL